MRHVINHRITDTVVVTLHQGGTFRGVLWDHDRQALVLRNAQALTEGATLTTVDGELIILLDNVLFIQVPG